MFLVLVAKAPAPVWKVARSSKTAAIVNIEKRREYVNHYSSHHRSGVGSRDDQDVGASAVRRADHPQRPRVRGSARHRGGDSIRQGRQLLHRGRRPGGPGPDRRRLVAGCGCRAAGPGLPTLDLHRVSVLRAGSRRPAQAAGQTTRRQARPNPPLPRRGTRRAHHRRAAHPARPGRRPDPGRGAQPTHGTQTRALDPCRPRLRTNPYRYANALQRSRHRNTASRSRIRHKPAIPHHQQIVRSRSSSG